MQPLPTRGARPGPSGRNGCGCPGGSVGADRPRRSTGVPQTDTCSRIEGRHEVMSAGSIPTSPSGAFVVAATLPPGASVATTAGDRRATA
jgi:hypothetical protein